MDYEICSDFLSLAEKDQNRNTQWLCIHTLEVRAESIYFSFLNCLITRSRCGLIKKVFSFMLTWFFLFYLLSASLNAFHSHVLRESSFCVWHQHTCFFEDRKDSRNSKPLMEDPGLAVYYLNEEEQDQSPSGKDVYKGTRYLMWSIDASVQLFWIIDVLISGKSFWMKPVIALFPKLSS